MKKRRVSDSSSTNKRFVSRGELEERLNLAQAKKQQLMQRVAKLTAQLDEDLSEKAIFLDKSSHNFIKKILSSEQSNNATSPFDEESAQWLLWQQKAQCESKGPSGMCWHPLIIRFDLSDAMNRLLFTFHLLWDCLTSVPMLLFFHPANLSICRKL